jgi:hypothetical protein
MIREILKMGDPRLLQVASPVEDIRDFALRAITTQRSGGVSAAAIALFCAVLARSPAPTDADPI